MRRSAIAAAAVLLLPVLAYADDDERMHDHHQMEVAAPNDPPIKVTINPEARVTVLLVGVLPPPAPCGAVAEFPVKIVNQGFITARLEAQLVGDPAGVTLAFRPDPLKGAPEESRQLHITLAKPGLTDITVVFKAHTEVPDLGGRDRVHFLMQCRPIQ